MVWENVETECGLCRKLDQPLRFVLISGDFLCFDGFLGFRLRNSLFLFAKEVPDSQRLGCSRTVPR